MHIRRIVFGGLLIVAILALPMGTGVVFLFQLFVGDG